MEPVKNKVVREFLRQGFSLVRFSQPPIGSAANRFSQWLARGYAGTMSYLQRRQEDRLHPQRLLPNFKSIILLAYPYDTSLINTQDPQRANISRYAWGEDYHPILEEKLKTLQEWLERTIPHIHCYTSVDAGPVMEKAWAAKAGLGWMGKHTNMIHPEQGSYFFIASILTDYPFEPDRSQSNHCGTCTACIDVCPTKAIVAPYVLDAQLCISYLTIELKGPIPRRLRPLIGNRIFGCDDCQEVCPWNRFSQRTEEERFFPKDGLRNEPLTSFLGITPEEFKERFAQSAISRPKWRGFMRNVLVAMGNSGRSDWAPLVKEKFASEEPLVRGHAVWAYHQLLGEGVLEALSDFRERETDPFVLEEINSALMRDALL